jgi:hypothetical protein
MTKANLTYKKGCTISDTNKKWIEAAIPFAIDRLGIKGDFSIDIMPSDSNNTIHNLNDDLKKAVFIPSMRKMEIYVKNRHILDILVSMVHEMVHLAQMEKDEALMIGGIPYDIPDDHPGKEIEYEAYAKSGMIVRAFRGLINNT